MERLNALAESLKHVAQLLAEDVLEPDAAREDWASLTVRVGMARRGLEEALAALDGALEEAEDDDSRALVRQRTAEMAGRMAALLLATGDAPGGRLLLERARLIAQAPEQRAKLEAGLEDPEHFALYEHALWAWGQERAEQSRDLLRRVADGTRQKTLKALAREGLRATDPNAAPQPIDKAPALFTLNGCGVGLYGKRDEAPDGTYVATYFICLLFLPVLPLTAYRVQRMEGSSWRFFAKEPLGPVARVWQRLVLVGLVGALAWTGLDGYLHSPARLARLALDEARTAEATLPPEEALRGYQTVLAAHEEPTVRAQAAEAVVRLSLAKLPSPCTRGSRDAVDTLLAKLTHLPEDLGPGGARDVLARRLEACVAQLGQATTDDVQAALDLARQAQDVVGEHPVLQARRAALTRAQADLLVKESPLQALALYTELSGEDNRDAARAVLDSLGEAPSLWLEAEASVRAWLERGDVRASSPEAQRSQERLTQARATHEKDEALIAEGDEAKLAAALEASPGNQELTVAVATRRLERGEADAAAKLVEALGAPGRLTGEARVLLASCHRERGALAEADAVLSAFVSERLSAFRRASRAYEQMGETVQRELLVRARQGQLPRELEQRLEAASGEEEQRGIYREWLSAQLEQEPRLERLRAEYLRHQPVVPAALMLGMVKLQRAHTAPEETRATLLGEAERTFLAIRQDAEDNPHFHLGLGQVYHRLGRSQEGDAELQGLVARGGPAITLEVAETYRELDRVAQARALVETVYTTTPDEPLKHVAASRMALMSVDEEEREQWLLKSDTSLPYVQDSLLNLRAQRATREGALTEADRLLAQLANRLGQEARHDTTAANNLALTLMRRFEVTGDVEHLRSAVRHLENAARLQPDSALVLGNLADALEHLGQVTVLERWVRTRPLHPTQSEAEHLLNVLLASSLREQILGAMDADPSLRRAQAFAQQEQVLAPGKSRAWARRLRWLQQRRDARGLQELARRLEPLPPFGEGHNAGLREKWESGSEDERLARSTTQDVTVHEATLARAEQTHHAPTIAAAWWLLGEARWDQHRVMWAPEQLPPLVDAYRQAVTRWAPLGAEGDLEMALTLTALEHGAGRSEVLAQAWKAERRTQGVSLTIHHVLKGPGGTQVVRVLREQPELQEAAEHARRRAPSAPKVADWVLAKAAGDVVLEQAAAALFTRPDVKLSLDLDARLAGDGPQERSARELFQEARAGGAVP